MPKNVVIIIVVILVLGGGAALLFQNQNTNTTKNETQKGNVITSIKDALAKSVSLECTYTNEQVGDSKTYVKNGAVRSNYSGKKAGQGGSVIIANNKMYLWQGKEGMMMDIPEVTGTPQGQSAGSQKDSFVNDLEKYKQYCKPAVVAESLFIPPADVKFQDYTQMMQQSKQTMPPQDSSNQTKPY